MGLPASDAEKVAALMAEADARGADGHGVFRLPQYIKRIQSGGINVTPNIQVIREQAASALVEGDNAMGHLVMSHAAEIAVEKALKQARKIYEPSKKAVYTVSEIINEHDAYQTLANPKPVESQATNLAAAESSSDLNHND